MFQHVISIPTPGRRLVLVSVDFESQKGEIDLVFPVWTPGSYMIREHQRFINDLTASDAQGRPIPVHKLEKNRYRLALSEPGKVSVRYEAYAHQLTVRTNHVDASHAFLNPVALLPYVEGREEEEQRMKVQDLPSGWGAACALDEVDGWFVAKNYDELADSPLECGPHAQPEERIRFEAAGVPHEIVIWGRFPKRERLVEDVRKIVEAQAQMIGGLPYERYLIILMTAKGYGGLEHRASTALLFDRDDLHSERGYEDFLSLVSHELFHVWNVKRIKPAVFSPYNLNHENYTRLLWVFEGFTSYYQDVFLLRAGLISKERWLQIVGEMLTRLARVEGRKRQSVAEASFDAWIRLYLRDEETDNSSVSYYLKGALVALTLDLELRRLSSGNYCLDDVVRLMWERFGAGNGGIEETAMEALIDEVAQKAAGVSIRPLVEHIVYTTEELPLEELLASHGLSLSYRAASGDSDRGGKEANAASLLKSYLGASLKLEGSQLKVLSVRRDSPADRGGLCPGDELVAIDGLKAPASTSKASEMLHRFEPGQLVKLTVFRREELHSVDLVASPPKLDTAVVRPLESASDEQKRLLTGLLGVS